MRTVRIKVYKFDELSAEAKKKAIEQFWDTNVNHDWWEYTYSDAAQIGLEITGFDIDRGNISGQLQEYAHIVAENIKAEHGEFCDIYKLAVNYLDELAKLTAKHKEDTDEYESELERNAQAFEKALLKAYLKMLRDEYEYQTSEAQVIESIRSNEYDFRINGQQWY
jgi:hypothetical protein